MVVVIVQVLGKFVHIRHLDPQRGIVRLRVQPIVENAIIPCVITIHSNIRRVPVC